MTWILLIGPTKWVSGHKPELPEDLVGLLPRSWTRRGLDILSPIDIRAILVGLLRREGHDAVLMEDEPRQGREPLLRKFSRLVREHLKGRFFVYWPVKANMRGVAWELSHLGTRVDDQVLSAEQVHLFLQEGVAKYDEEGEMLLFLEEGGRSYYDSDLDLFGCRIHNWSDYESLMEKVIAFGKEQAPREE